MGIRKMWREGQEQAGEIEAAFRSRAGAIILILTVLASIVGVTVAVVRSLL